MADTNTTMDDIKIKVVVDSTDAKKQLNSLASSVKSLGGTGKDFQKITNGIASLNGVKIAPSLCDAISKLAKCVAKIDTTGANNLSVMSKALASLGKLNISGNLSAQIESVITSLSKLSNAEINSQVVSSLKEIATIKISTTVANNIVKIGDAAKGLADTDFSKLRELVDILSELKGMGDVRINLTNGTASATNSMNSLNGNGLSDGQYVNVNPQTGGQAQQIPTTETKQNTAQTVQEASTLSTVFSEVSSTVSQVNAYLAAAKAVIGTIKSIVATVVKAAQTVWRIIKSIANTLTKIGKSITKAVLAPFVAVGNAVSSVFGKIKEIVDYAKRMALRQILRKAINAVTDGLKEGIENLYNWSGNNDKAFSKTMDDIATSLLYFKNSVGAAVAPLLNALAPAIRVATDAAVDMLNIINQLFAKLTGADTWTKAIRKATTYSDETDKAADSTEKLKRSLIGLDEIHALNDNDSSSSSSSSSSTDTSGMFETIEVETEDITKNFGGVWESFKAAWDNDGQSTIDSIKTSIESIKSLLNTLKQTLNNVFSDGRGTEIFQDLLGIIENIATAAGNFAENFKSAWGDPGDKKSNGYTILSNLTDALGSILEAWNKITESFANWTKDVNLKPFLESFAKFSEAIKTVAENLGDDFEYGWEKILKPMLTWLAEDAAPASINLVTAALEALEEVLTPIKDGFKDAWDNTKGFREAIGALVLKNLQSVIDFFTDLKDNIPDDEMEAIRSATSKLVTLFVEKLGSAILAASNAFANFVTQGKLADVIRKLGDVAAAIVGIYNGLKILAKYYIMHFKTVFATLSPSSLLNPSTVRELGEGWAEFWNDAASGISGGIEEAEAVEDWFDSIADGIDAASGKSSTDDTYSKLFITPISTGINSAIESAKGSLSAIPTYLGSETYTDSMATNATLGFSPIGKQAGEAADAAKGKFKNIAQVFNKDSATQDSLKQLLMTKATNTFAIVPSCAASATKDTRTEFAKVASVFNKDASTQDSLKQKLKTNATNTFSIVKNCAASATRNTKTAFMGIASVFNKDSATKDSLKQKLQTNATNTFSIVKSCAASATTNTKDAFKGISDVFATSSETKGSLRYNLKNDSATAFSCVTDSAGGAVKNIKDKFDDLPTYITKCFGNAWDGAATNLKFSGSVKVTATVAGIDKDGYKIQAAATGGVFSQGQMFIAREAGPELVGQLGNRTAVMNNNQIVDSVASGVASANAQQNILLREQNSLLRQLIAKDSNVRAYVTTSDIINGLTAANKRSGKALVPVTA